MSFANHGRWLRGLGTGPALTVNGHTVCGGGSHKRIARRGLRGHGTNALVYALAHHRRLYLPFLGDGDRRGRSVFPFLLVHQPLKLAVLRK